MAADFLEAAGISLTDHPTPEITHLLLDIPSFGTQEKLRDGADAKELLRRLPASVTVIGGRLKQPLLSAYRTLDLLADPFFTAKNASITAECALQAAAPYLKTTFADSPSLILGWGRIGKNLAKLLRSLGCRVTVAARKEKDRAVLESFGYRAVDFSAVPEILKEYRILFNTVPELPFKCTDLCKSGNCIMIDLASSPGLDGTGAVTARGLPGKYAPETTGKLIAETILIRIREERI
jgi:dipicolinate synthase subunit A